MKWRSTQQQEGKKERKKEKEEVKKQTSHCASSSLSSSSSSFSLSSVLPFSWFAKLTASKPPKRRGVAGGGSGRRVAEVFTPPPSPSRHPRSASAHLPFFPAVLDRFPPPVHDAAAPHRLSLGDDEGGGLQQRAAPRSARHHHRSARHHSVGDLELTLGHIIPFSRRAATARWAESDSGTDASGCDLGIGRRPPRRRRRRRSARASAGLSPETRVGSDGKDGLPRRSISGKIRHRAKVKVRSPRPTTAELERLRAAAKRGRGEEEGSGRRKKGLERFAVVKCSCDPQRDFRESMVEMIWQKGIGRPEDLESLLACYLSLNADEHHDVIVKVFRQVWFELNPERLAPECNLRR